jgi:hypothetical protein
LLNQIPGPLASFIGDGAYDQAGIYGTVAERHPEAVLHRSAGERTQPTPRLCLSDADGLRAPKLKHLVQGLNCNGDLSGAAVFRPRA